MVFKHFWIGFVLLVTIFKTYSKEDCYYTTFKDENFVNTEVIRGHNEHDLSINSSTPEPIDLHFPSAITNALNNLTTKSKYDSYIYYNSSTINDEEVFNHYWLDLFCYTHTDLHGILSSAHCKTHTVKLKFLFPFYGRTINATTITTGGFLFLGENYIHPWITVTQYIAPLMANFDFSISNYSNVYYMSNDTAFTVTWLNVTVQDKLNTGGFTFQTTLYSNGKIVFAYKHLPIKIKEIHSNIHPVKIGLSDAYMMDKVISDFKTKKFIFEYDTVLFNPDEVFNSTVIILSPLPICTERKNCESCIKNYNSLQCYWCDNQCISRTDYHSQQWIKKGCVKLLLHPKSMCESENSILSSTSYDNSDTHPPKRHVYFIFAITLMVITTCWTIYAYLNPTTRSGQLLMNFGVMPCGGY